MDRSSTSVISTSVSACVPKNTKIPPDRVLTLVVKRDHALSPSSNPKEKGHVSIKDSKFTCDGVLALAVKRDPALSPSSNPKEKGHVPIKDSKIT